MEVIKKLEKEMMRMDIPDFFARRHSQGPCEDQGRRKNPNSGFSGCRHQQEEQRGAVHLHRTQDFLRRGRGEGIPVALAHHRPDRSGHQGPCAQGQDLPTCRKLRGKAARIKEKKIRLAFGSIFGADSGAFDTTRRPYPRPLASLIQI